MAYDPKEYTAHLATLTSIIERARPDRRPLMMAHWRAQKRVWAMKETDFASYDAYERSFDEAVEDETDAREALARSPGIAEGFMQNLEYLNTLCLIETTLPLIHAEYGAVAIAVDTFLKQ